MHGGAQKMQSGFTLIELLVVISIIGLLSTLAVIALSSARAKSRDVKRISDLKQVQTALEMFYDTYKQYPVTSGAPTWDGHWQNFATCLETGVGCGFSISGYQAVMGKVPQDPQDSPATLSDADPTYYYGYPGCAEGYRVHAYLETNHPALQGDVDGSFYNSGGQCNDASAPYGYCVGAGTCTGF